MNGDHGRPCDSGEGEGEGGEGGGGGGIDIEWGAGDCQGVVVASTIEQEFIGWGSVEVLR